MLHDLIWILTGVAFPYALAGLWALSLFAYYVVLDHKQRTLDLLVCAALTIVLIGTITKG